MKPSRHEINYCIDLLEREGYLVRRPSEASFPVTLEVVPHEHTPYEVAVRADTVFNGHTCSLAQRFPAELLLNPDDSSFREREAPIIMARKLGQYVADSLAPALVEQAKQKIEPLVPEKRMSLLEIESYLAWALRDCRAEPDDGTVE